jgi:sialic acid synthase SpsE
MLDSVASMGKPVLVSTGAKTDAETERACAWLEGRVPWYTLMTCTAAYPADFIEVDGWAGFSDHTLGYTAAVAAAKRGALVIEKHFTAFPDIDTPDRPHSLTPKQFRRMVDIIRGRQVESEEQAMYLRHNRRLIATCDITPGEVMIYGVNFGAYRALQDEPKAMHPFDWELVHGQVAKREIRCGRGVERRDV